MIRPFQAELEGLFSGLFIKTQKIRILCEAYSNKGIIRLILFRVYS